MTSAVIVALMVILALLIAAVVLDVKQYDGIYWARMTEGMSNTARAIRTQITTPAPPKKLIGEGMTSIESIAATPSTTPFKESSASCNSSGNLAVASLLPKDSNGVWSDAMVNPGDTSDYVRALESGTTAISESLGSTRLTNLQLRPDPAVGAWQPIRSFQSDIPADANRRNFAMY